jgi:hypothetical protein
MNIWKNIKGNYGKFFIAELHNILTNIVNNY